VRHILLPSPPPAPFQTKSFSNFSDSVPDLSGNLIRIEPFDGDVESTSLSML